jgi:hypothetical protein
MPLITNQPNYLTPVYNPIQYNLTTGIDNDANPIQDRFVLNIYFSSSTSDSEFVVGDFINLGGNRIEWVASNPNPNQIPTGETSLQNQVRFIEQILDNNLIFEPYDVVFFAVSTSPRIFRLQLTSNETYPPLQTLITWTSSTTNKLWFEFVYPDYNTLGNIRDNYSLEFKLFYDWLRYPFNVSAIVTGTTWLPSTAQTKNFLSSFYKIYQPINQHWFNLAETLQTVSSTDKYLLSGVSSTSIDNIFKYDLNSLHNYGIQTYDLYSDDGFGVRRYGSNVNENKWFWNASKLFDSKFQFDTTPYYEMKYKFTGLTSAYTFQSINLILDYQLKFGDSYFYADASTPDEYTYICSSFTDNTLYADIRYFALEQFLSGTTKNLRDMISADIGTTDFQFTQTNFGYSKSVLNISAKTTSAPIITLDPLNNESGNINTVVVQDQSIDYLLRASGTTNQIKFLTDRPRTGTDIYFPYKTGNSFSDRPITLSIFITPSYPLPVAITDYDVWYGFRLVAKTFTEVGSISNNSNDSPLIYTDFASNQNEYLDYYNPFYKKNGLYHININPRALFGGPASKFGVKTMQVNLQHNIRSTLYAPNEDNFVFPYSETFEFNLVELCEYETLKTFVFLNGLGGWDYVDFIDDLTTEYNRSQALMNTRYDNRITKETVDEIVLQNFITKNYKVSRSIQTEQEYEWLYDLVKSSEVYYIDLSTNSYIPVIVTGIDYIDIENTNQTKLLLEYRIAQSDISQKSV